MTWWVWVLLWVILVVGAGVVFFLLGRSLWRKVSALLRELGAAADRLSVVSAELSAMAATGQPEEPAIFSDPAELRRQRFAARRAARRDRRRDGHRAIPPRGSRT